MVPLFPSCCRKVAVRSHRSGLGAREPTMNAAISRLGPAAAKFARQIVPPVIATLIAGGTIWRANLAAAGPNREMAAFIVGSRAPSPERCDLTATLRQQLGKSG